jgi:hypothetical protein
VTRVIHAKHVWAPIQLVLSRNLAKRAILTSPSQLCTRPNEPFLQLSFTSRRTATLEDRMHHLESLIQAIPPAVFAAGSSALSPSSPSDRHPSIPLLQNHSYPAEIPPPSLTVAPLMNPSTHFALAANRPCQSNPQLVTLPYTFQGTANDDAPASDIASEEAARMSLSSSYLYVDDEGFTRWQGETSGLPILDLLIERHHSSPKKERDSNSRREWPNSGSSNSDSTWFPDRTTRHQADMNSERVWKLVTSLIAPDLMDRYVYVVHLGHPSNRLRHRQVLYSATYQHRITRCLSFMFQHSSM